MASDETRFEYLASQLESHLKRRLTPDERRALRLSFPIVEIPTVVDRRKRARENPDDNDSANPTAAD